MITELISASGLARAGGIDQSLRLEVGGDLHEFGTMSRPISVEEARLLVPTQP